MSRVHLGRAASFLRQLHADLLDDAVETIRSETLETRRTRVFFDEVRMVTLHRQIPQDVLWTGVVLAVIGVAVGIPLMLEFPLAGAVTGIALGAPGIVMVAFALLRGCLVLTVQGPRLHARVTAVLHQERVTWAHHEILRRVAAAQAASAPEPAPPSP